MRRDLSLVALFSYCLMKWKVLVVFMLTGAILLGGFQAFRQKKAYDQKAQEVIDVEELQKEIDILNLQIRNNNSALDQIEEYLTESKLMSIDPYEVYSCTVDLAVELIDDSDFSQTVEYNTTPVSYMTSKIQDLYKATWKSSDFADSLDLSSFGLSEGKYISELISVNSVSGGIIEITAVGESEEEAKELAESTAAFLRGQSDQITEVSYKHTLSTIMESQKCTIDESLADKKVEKINSVSTLEATIEDQSKQVAEKQASINGIDSKISVSAILIKTAEYGIIGAILFAVLACLLMYVKVIVEEKMVGSKEACCLLDLDHICSLNRRKGIYRITNALLRENVWSTSEEVKEYLEAVISHENGKIIFTSSLEPAELKKNREVEVIDTLTKEHVLAYDMLKNAKSREQIGKDSTVILVEKSLKSCLSNIEEEISICRENGAVIAGMIFVQ